MSAIQEAPRLSNHFEISAFEFLQKRGLDLIRVALMPTTGAFIISCLVAIVYSGPEIAYLLYGAVGIMFAAEIHRMMVNGDDPGWVLFRFQEEEWTYAAVVLLYCIGAIVVNFFDTLFGGIGRNIAGFTFIWLVLRLILMFPHAAVRGQIDFELSCTRMRANIWRLSLIGFRKPPSKYYSVLTTYALLNILFALVSYAAVGVAKTLFQALAAGIAIAIGAALFSAVYVELVSNHAVKEEADEAPLGLWQATPDAG